MIPDEIAKPMRDFMTTNKWAIIITITSIAIGLGSIIFLGKDNVVEQEVEKIIAIETGVNLDLTPNQVK